MRCPKCGYTSFDYNQVCPKCNKDISTEQVKMNLPSYKPDPPSLLEAFIGDTDDSQTGLGDDSSSEYEAVAPDESMELDDSGGLEGEEISVDDSQEIEMSLDADDSGELEISVDDGGGSEISVDDSGEVEDVGEMEISTGESIPDFDLEVSDTDEIVFETDEISPEESETPLSMPDEGDGQEEISLDLGDLTEEGTSTETSGGDEEMLAIDLGDLSFDESGEAPLAESEETVEGGEETDIDLDAFALEVDEGTPQEAEDEIELNLDDLKVNDTGELEIGQTPEISLEEGPISLDLESLSPDEVSSEEAPSADGTADQEEISLDLDDISLDGTGEHEYVKPEASEGTIELEDFDLELELDKSE